MKSVQDGIEFEGRRGRPLPGGPSRGVMMIKIPQFLLVGLVFPCALLAGEIYGNITEGRAPVSAGVKVEVLAGGKLYPGSTDQYGSYRIQIPEKGKGEIKVHHKEQTASMDVFSYEGPVRYDLVLEQKEGKLSLKRK
jgi:hypothetical protein